jgi:dihydropteroate synthase
MPVESAPVDAARAWTLPGRRPVVLRQPAEVMGVLNATPDSFSDGGRHLDAEAAATAGAAMVAAGAAWLDVGGESTRPGAEGVSVEVELARVLPVIERLRARLPGARISIDTSKGEVARRALAAGADLVNDIAAGADPALLEAVAATQCPLVLMHMQGTPATMQRAPRYHDLIGEVEAFFAERLKAAAAAGVPASMVVLDPGIGFGKTVAHNLQLLRSLPRLARAFDRPLMVGLSRKSFIARLLGEDGSSPTSRDQASHILHALVARDCALLRVHDVPGAVAACRLAAAYQGEGAPHA